MTNQTHRPTFQRKYLILFNSKVLVLTWLFTFTVLVLVKTMVISIVVICLFLTLWTAVAIISSRWNLRRPDLANKRRTLHLVNITHITNTYSLLDWFMA